MDEARVWGIDSEEAARAANPLVAPPNPEFLGLDGAGRPPLGEFIRGTQSQRKTVARGRNWPPSPLDISESIHQNGTD